jgi:hypothetical protein
MEAKHNLRVVAVWAFGVVMATIVIVTHKEPQASAEHSPERQRILRELVQDRESGTYSLRQQAEE